MCGTISRRWAAMVSSLFVCLLSIVSVACADNTTMTKNSPPAPLLFEWRWEASVGATTPQAAYALSAHFAPCLLPSDSDHTTTASDQSVTWLLSGPDVGVAYLRATCRDTSRGNYLYRNFLEVVKGVQNAWYADGFQRRLPFPTAVDPTPTTDPGVPSLSDLFPTDTYLALPPSPWRTSEPVSLAGRAWVALTPRDYSLGLIRASVIRPSDAISTKVDGLPGWMTEANGMATVVAQRPDGTVFFSGTGSASEVEAIAARALPRAEDALGGPLSPTITPTP